MPLAGTHSGYQILWCDEPAVSLALNRRLQAAMPPAYTKHHCGYVYHFIPTRSKLAAGGKPHATIRP
jgi:hypothetical protein